MQPALIVPEEVSSRPRKRLPWSFLIAGIAILGAVAYLVYANTQANAVYYMTVSELKSCTSLACTTQSVRVAGVVQAGTIVPVVYSGIVPDIFRPGIEVVVEGHYSGHGAFQALTLLTKCPSKFQAAPNS